MYPLHYLALCKYPLLNTTILLLLNVPIALSIALSRQQQPVIVRSWDRPAWCVTMRRVSVPVSSTWVSPARIPCWVSSMISSVRPAWRTTTASTQDKAVSRAPVTHRVVIRLSVMTLESVCVSRPSLVRSVTDANRGSICFPRKAARKYNIICTSKIIHHVIMHLFNGSKWPHCNQLRPLNPHDALKHHFASQKNDLIS